MTEFHLKEDHPVAIRAMEDIKTMLPKGLTTHSIEQFEGSSDYRNRYKGGCIMSISGVKEWLWHRLLIFLRIRKSYNNEYKIGEVTEDTFSYDITTNKDKTND